MGGTVRWTIPRGGHCGEELEPSDERAEQQRATRVAGAWVRGGAGWLLQPTRGLRGRRVGPQNEKIESWQCARARCGRCAGAVPLSLPLPHLPPPTLAQAMKRGARHRGGVHGEAVALMPVGRGRSRISARNVFSVVRGFAALIAACRTTA